MTQRRLPDNYFYNMTPRTMQQSGTDTSQQGFIGDTVDIFQRGVGQATAGLFDFLGANGVSDQLTNWADSQLDTVSDETRQSVNKNFVTRNEEGELVADEGISDLRTWWFGLANVAGQFAPSLVGTKGLDKLSKVAKGSGLGAKGTTAAYSAIGGSTATGQAEKQIRDIVDEWSVEQLAASDVYRNLVMQTDENLSAEERLTQAREALKDQLETEVKTDWKTLLANFGGSAIGDPIIGKALGGTLAKSFKGGFAKGFAAESLTEALQEGMQQRGINVVAGQVDGRDPMQGVYEGAITGGLLGGAFGGTVGGISGALSPNTPESNAPEQPTRTTTTGSDALDSAIDDLDRNVQMPTGGEPQGPQPSQDPDLDVPTAARNAGFNTNRESSNFGKFMQSPVQEALRSSQSKTVEDLLKEARENAQREATAQSDDEFTQAYNEYNRAREFANVPQGYTYNGEYIPASEAPRGTGLMVPPARIGLGDIDGQVVAPTPQLPNSEQSQGIDTRLRAESQLAKMAQQPKAIPDKNIIYGDDGRPRQAAQRMVDEARDSGNRRIAQKDIIFAEDNSGIQVRSSGKPFGSANAALRSEQARQAVKQGATVEPVELANGFGWREVAVSNPPRDALVTPKVDSPQPQGPENADIVDETSTRSANNPQNPPVSDLSNVDNLDKVTGAQLKGVESLNEADKLKRIRTLGTILNTTKKKKGESNSQSLTRLRGAYDEVKRIASLPEAEVKGWSHKQLNEAAERLGVPKWRTSGGRVQKTDKLLEHVYSKVLGKAQNATATLDTLADLKQRIKNNEAIPVGYVDAIPKLNTSFAYTPKDVLISKELGVDIAPTGQRGENEEVYEQIAQLEDVADEYIDVDDLSPEQAQALKPISDLVASVGNLDRVLAKDSGGLPTGAGNTLGRIVKAELPSDHPLKRVPRTVTSLLVNNINLIDALRRFDQGVTLSQSEEQTTVQREQSASAAQTKAKKVDELGGYPFVQPLKLVRLQDEGQLSAAHVYEIISGKVVYKRGGLSPSDMIDLTNDVKTFNTKFTAHKLEGGVRPQFRGLALSDIAEPSNDVRDKLKGPLASTPYDYNLGLETFSKKLPNLTKDELITAAEQLPAHASKANTVAYFKETDLNPTEALARHYKGLDLAVDIENAREDSAGTGLSAVPLYKVWDDFDKSKTYSASFGLAKAFLRKASAALGWTESDILRNKFGARYGEGYGTKEDVYRALEQALNSEGASVPALHLDREQVLAELWPAKLNAERTRRESSANMKIERDLKVKDKQRARDSEAEKVRVDAALAELNAAPDSDLMTAVDEAVEQGVSAFDISNELLLRYGRMFPDSNNTVFMASDFQALAKQGDTDGMKARYQSEISYAPNQAVDPEPDEATPVIEGREGTLATVSVGASITDPDTGDNSVITKIGDGYVETFVPDWDFKGRLTEDELNEMGYSLPSTEVEPEVEPEVESEPAPTLLNGNVEDMRAHKAEAAQVIGEALAKINPKLDKEMTALAREADALAEARRKEVRSLRKDASPTARADALALENRYRNEAEQAAKAYTTVLNIGDTQYRVRNTKAGLNRLLTKINSLKANPAAPNRNVATGRINDEPSKTRPRLADVRQSKADKVTEFISEGEFSNAYYLAQNLDVPLVYTKTKAGLEVRAGYGDVVDVGPFKLVVTRALIGKGFEVVELNTGMTAGVPAGNNKKAIMADSVAVLEDLIENKPDQYRRVMRMTEEGGGYEGLEKQFLENAIYSKDAINEQGNEYDRTDANVYSVREEDTPNTDSATDVTTSEPRLRPAPTRYVKNQDVEELTYAGGTIRHYVDVASLLASYRKNAQEVMLAAVVDADGKVIRVLKHSVGGPASSQVFLGVLAGSIVDVPNAESVWFAHNHPTGNPKQSDADRLVTDNLKSLMDGSGVEVKGMVVVAGQGDASVYLPSNREEYPFKIHPQIRRDKVSVSERKIMRRPSAPPINSPTGLLSAIDAMGADTDGVLLLNNQNVPLSFIPLTLDQMTTLRGGKLPDILKGIHQGNATAAAIVSEKSNSFEDSRVAVANLNGMLNAATLNVIDQVVLNPMGAYSVLGQGSRVPSLASYEIFRSQTTGKKKKVKGVNAPTAQRTANKFISDLDGANGIKVKILDTTAEAEKMWRMSLSGSTVKGAYSEMTNTVYIIAENIDGNRDLMQTLAHETIAHGGLDTVIGKEAKQAFINRIKRTRGRKAFKKYWQDADKDYADMDENVKAEEIFARFVENEPTKGDLKAWWNEFKRFIRTQLSKVGITYKPDADVEAMRDMLDSIVRGFKRGEESLPRPTSNDLMFSQIADEASRKIGQGEAASTQPIKDTIRNWVNSSTRAGEVEGLKNSGARFIEGVFDGLSGIDRAERDVLGDSWSFERAGYISARLATGVGDTMTAILTMGAPKWTTDDKGGEYVGEIENTQGLLKTFEFLGADLNDWLGWMAGNRAERLAEQGLENNLSAEEIQELKSRARGKEAKFEEARQQYKGMHSAILDLAEQGGVIKPEERANWDEDWYVPFYREADESKAEFGDVIKQPYTKGGIANQSAQVRKLLGSKLPTADLLQNILQRELKFVDAAMKNKAMLDVVANLEGTKYLTQIKGTAKNRARVRANRDNVISVLDEGVAKYYEVNDAALLRGMIQVGVPRELEGIPMRAARAMKRILTTGVTSSPDFIVRNFLRDSLSAWALNGDKMTVGLDSARGVLQTLNEDPDYRAAMFSGSSFQGGYIHGTDPEAATEMIRRQLAKDGLDQEGQTAWLKTRSSISQIWQKYRTVGDKIENANRIATYKAARKQGKGIKQALFESKDLMDFSMQGNYPTVRFFADVLPFFNARLVGLHKLARAVRGEDKKRVAGLIAAHVAKHGVMIAVASMALAASNEDDERYKKLKDWDKDANWHFFLGDDHFRLPKPFEIGVMFGTMFERGYLASGDTQDSEDLKKATLHALVSTFSMNPIPQLFRPTLEAVTNKDWFRDAPLDNLGDLRLEAGLRKGRNTSYIFSEIGEAMNVSPKRLEHMWKGYTGTLGGYALAMGDTVARWATGQPSKPEANFHDYPLIKSFYRDSSLPSASTRYSEEFYNLLQDSQTAYATYNQYLEEGRFSEARDYQQENREVLQERKKLSATQRQLSALKTQIDLVYKSTTMSPARKRERVDALTKRINRLQQRVVAL